MYTFKEILKCLTEELNKEFDPMTYSLWISKNSMYILTIDMMKEN